MIRKLFVLALLIATPVAAESFVVIKNAKNSTPALSRAELKEMVLGKRKEWRNDGRVKLILGGEDSGGTRWLAEQVFGVAAKTLITKIRQEVFKGELSKPVACGSDAECIQHTQGNPGALAFVTASTKLPADVAVVPVAE